MNKKYCKDCANFYKNAVINTNQELCNTCYTTSNGDMSNFIPMTFKNVTCEIREYSSERLLAKVKLPEPPTGLDKETIINYGRKIITLINEIHKTTDLHPHLVRFNIPNDGIYNHDMQKIIEYEKL